MAVPKLQKIRWSMAWHRNWMSSTAQAPPDIVTIQQLDEIYGPGPGRFTGPLTVAWPRRQEQGFWERYLRRWDALPSARPRECRRALLPVRSGRPVAVEADGDDAAVATECFLHQWGASVVVTINLKAPDRDLARTVERLLELRHEDRFTVEGGPLVTLEEVAAATFDRVRDTYAPEAEEQFGEPISILTVLQGTGEKVEIDPAAEPTARFLHAATSFSLIWKEDTLPELAAATVARLKHAPSSHVIYGNSRGRAIWAPTFFLARPEASTLSCLHRNQTLAAMQTEAMGSFVADTVRRMEQAVALSGEHRDRSRLAAEALAKLYRGDPETYRSGAIMAQIKAGGYVEPINRILVANQRPELS